MTPAATFLQGIDVFSGDDPLNATAIRDAGGKQFVIVKVTGGTGYTNPNWKRDLESLRAAHEVEGGYHYAHELGSQGSGVDEWRHFARTLGSIEGLLPGSYDLESTRLTYADCRAWIDLHYQTWHAWPILYGSPYFLRDLLRGDPHFAHCPPWIAHYYWDARGPLVPPPWGNMTRSMKRWTPTDPTGFAFWQYSDTGSVPGVSAANVDHDVFNGDINALRALVIGSPPVTPPPVQKDWFDMATMQDLQKAIRSTMSTWSSNSQLARVEPGSTEHFSAVAGTVIWLTADIAGVAHVSMHDAETGKVTMVADVTFAVPNLAGNKTTPIGSHSYVSVTSPAGGPRVTVNAFPPAHS